MHKPRIALVWQIMIGMLAGIAIGACCTVFLNPDPGWSTTCCNRLATSSSS